MLPNESNKPTKQTINFWFGENVVYTIFNANAWRGVTADNFAVVLIFQKKMYNKRAVVMLSFVAHFETLLIAFVAVQVYTLKFGEK